MNRLNSLNRINRLNGPPKQGGVSWSSYCKPLSAFYSDGTESGGQLLDISGNARHATITDNLITDPSGENGSVLVKWTNGTLSNSDEQAHSGTKSFKFTHTSTVAIAGARYQYFRTLPGETVNFSFWIYRATNAVVNLQVLKGDGSTGWQSLAATPTLNTWVQYTGSFTDAAGGGIGEIRAYVTTGDMTFYLDDLSITITDKPTVGVIMANDTTLKAIDTNYTFFTSGGIPKTVRTDIGDPTINNLRMFCGGTKQYIILDDIPTAYTRRLLYANFVDHDWVFDSCEVVKTVGSGKTYATIQAAIDSCTAGSITNRYRIDIYDSFSVTEYAEYTKNTTTIYQNIFATDKSWVYLNGIGDITIEGTLPEDATDDQLARAQLVDFFYTGGVRNIIFKKTNGRYACHIDATSIQNYWLYFVDCEFHHYGNQEVVDYRNSNELDLFTITQGGVTPLGMGMHVGCVYNFINCKASGIHPLTNHGGHESGSASNLLMYNCEMTSLALYHPTYNKTSALMASMRLDSTPGTNTVDSIARLMSNTYNVAISSDDSWTIDNA